MRVQLVQLPIRGFRIRHGVVVPLQLSCRANDLPIFCPYERLIYVLHRDRTVVYTYTYSIHRLLLGSLTEAS